MCTEIWLHWFRSVFLPGTAHLRQMGTPHEKSVVPLRVDGFEAHLCTEFIAEARENKVHILLSMPNATHLQAPLDVSCNSPFKSYFAEAKDEMRRQKNLKKQQLDVEGMIRAIILPLAKHKGGNAWELGFSALIGVPF